MSCRALIYDMEENNKKNITDDTKVQAEASNTVEYNDDNIRHLSDMAHVRTRPGMYIGRLGDG